MSYNTVCPGPNSCDTPRALTSITPNLCCDETKNRGTYTRVAIPIPKKGNAKECSNYHTIALISPASKVMLKILQARLQQYMNRELTDVQASFRKGRGTRDQIDSSRKTSTSALLTMPKPLTVWITIHCGKFLKRWEYQTT